MKQHLSFKFKIRNINLIILCPICFKLILLKMKYDNNSKFRILKLYLAIWRSIFSPILILFMMKYKYNSKLKILKTNLVICRTNISKIVLRETMSPSNTERAKTKLLSWDEKSKKNEGLHFDLYWMNKIFEILCHL